MGTTLTGTTPQDTYDSLIKVTDNGPLSGSLKKLTDGLGNDSSLSLSTSAASLSGTLAVSGASTFSGAITMALGGNPRLRLQDTDAGAGNVGIVFQEATSEKWTLASNSGSFQFFNEATASNAVWISSTNNVGIGTSSPAAKLDVSGGNVHSFYTYAGDASNYNFRVGNDLDSTKYGYLSQLGASTYLANNNYYASAGQFRPTATSASFIAQDGANISFFINTGLTVGTNYTPTERARFTANGLTFNGDTAAANALDDYEEGTWTPAFTMGTSGTVTMDTVLGRYTKIGNLVTCTGYANIASVSSPVGELRLGGLPFTTGSGSDGATSLFIYNFGNTTAVTAYQALVSQSLNYAIIRGYYNGGQVQDIGANVVGGAGMIFTITYRV